jgi:hypothetical protein
MFGFTLSYSNPSLAADRPTSSGGMRILRLGEHRDLGVYGRKPIRFASFALDFAFAFAFISYLMEVAHFIPLCTCLG